MGPGADRQIQGSWLVVTHREPGLCTLKLSCTTEEQVLRGPKAKRNPVWRPEPGAQLGLMSPSVPVSLPFGTQKPQSLLCLSGLLPC